jgi:hypothetical protein
MCFRVTAKKGIPPSPSLSSKACRMKFTRCQRVAGELLFQAAVSRSRSYRGVPLAALTPVCAA